MLGSNGSEDYDALSYRSLRNIESDEERATFSASWQKSIDNGYFLNNLSALRIAELYNMPDIDLVCDSCLQQYGNTMGHANFSLLKKAIFLFDLCRSKHLSRLLHTHLTSSNTTGLAKLNEVFGESKDDTEGWSPIITASAIFAFQRTEYTGLSVETLEEYLKSLLQYQSRDGGWVYSEKRSDTLSVFSTAISIHAFAVLKPSGWEGPAKSAANWLKTQCTDLGVWKDQHAAKSDAYLTVLALDAINLADESSTVTLQDNSPPVRNLSIEHLVQKETQPIEEKGSGDSDNKQAEPGIPDESLTPPMSKKVMANLMGIGKHNLNEQMKDPSFSKQHSRQSFQFNRGRIGKRARDMLDENSLSQIKDELEQEARARIKAKKARETNGKDKDDNSSGP